MPVKRTITVDAGPVTGPSKATLRRERTSPIIRSLHKVAPSEASELLPPARQSALPGSPDVYFVKDVRGLVRIDPAQIHYVQADGNYVELHLADRRVVLRNSLAEVLKMLPPCLLCQVNRAQAVNIHHLDLIGPNEVRIGELAFTLSKRYREPLIACVQVITGR